MKKAISVLALASGLMLAANPASAAIEVSFSPATTHIAVGGSVAVQMNISGLGDEILRAFDINMLFDSVVVVNNQVTHNIALQWGSDSVFGPSVFNTGDTGVIDFTRDSDATVAASQANSFTVLTFGFLGLADGFSSIRLGNSASERTFTGLNNGALDVQIGTACIAVGTGSCDNGHVPEPASIALAGIGLLAGLAARRRRREEPAA